MTRPATSPLRTQTTAAYLCMHDRAVVTIYIEGDTPTNAQNVSPIYNWNWKTNIILEDIIALGWLFFYYLRCKYWMFPSDKTHFWLVNESMEFLAIMKKYWQLCPPGTNQMFWTAVKWQKCPTIMVLILPDSRESPLFRYGRICLLPTCYGEIHVKM